jgi:two-component system chemotaxis sensor kinase CheA
MTAVAMSGFKDLYVRTAKEYLAALNDAFLHLEKAPGDEAAIDAIFRAAHSLKSQSAAMGFIQTGFLCHVVEDVFFAVKEHQIQIKPELADLLFQTLDALTDSVAHIEAENTELPVSDIAERLKRNTGLQAAGSDNSSSQQHTAPAAAVPTPVPGTNQTSSAVNAAAQSAERQTFPETSVREEHIKTIPVKVEQLDDIVASLEELMVFRLTMQVLVKKTGDPKLSQTQDKVDELIELIQFQVMKIRTVPLSMILDHFPRTVRDLGRTLNKQIELRVEGAELELDRTIVERLAEPLTHLVRNAADHGIGSSGTITIAAHAERDFAIVTVGDSGSGIDWVAVARKAGIDPKDRAAVKKALFRGISTATEVSQISGRGVGLEAVKKTIEDFGGSIDVASPPESGAIFTLRLPLTLSVVRTLIVRVGSERYAIAASTIDRSLKVNRQEIINNMGQEVFRYEDREIPLIRLGNIFNRGSENTHAGTYAVITNVDGERLALAVDAVNETLETVIRPLPGLLKGSRLFSGVTIVGDGSSVLLINPGGLSDE